MKPKRFFLIIFIIAILGIGVWWFLRPTAIAPEKIAEAPMPAKTTEPVLSKVEVPKQVTLPEPKPDATPVAVTQTIVESPPDPNAESKTELNAAFVDMARLYRAGDTAGFMRTYTEPDKLDSNLLQRIQANQDAIQSLPEADRAMLESDPLTQKMRDGIAKSYEELEDQIPTFNDSGTEATYMYTMPNLGFGLAPATQEPRTFIKINGKWYLKYLKPGGN